MSSADRNFNSHARVGRDKFRIKQVNKSADFNSHARVGRDPETMYLIRIMEISTHTPV